MPGEFAAFTADYQGPPWLPAYALRVSQYAKDAGGEQLVGQFREFRRPFETVCLSVTGVDICPLIQIVVARRRGTVLGKCCTLAGGKAAAALARATPIAARTAVPHAVRRPHRCAA